MVLRELSAWLTIASSTYYHIVALTIILVGVCTRLISTRNSSISKVELILRWIPWEWHQDFTNKIVSHRIEWWMTVFHSLVEATILSTLGSNTCFLPKEVASLCRDLRLSNLKLTENSIGTRDAATCLTVWHRVWTRTFTTLRSKKRGNSKPCKPSYSHSLIKSMIKRSFIKNKNFNIHSLNPTCRK